MMLREKLKLRRTLRELATNFVIALLLGLLLITAFGIAGTIDYEYWCDTHPSQCITEK